MKKLKFLLLILMICFSSGIAIYFGSEVETKLTKNDVSVIKILNLDKNCSDIYDFNKQIKCIESIQKKVFSIVSISHNGIGYYHTREPIDLMRVKKGLCYDRSRFIEKILTYYGFRYRHGALFYSDNNESFPCLRKKAYSHAFTEVYTKRGWMLVDSINLFIGLDKNGKVYTAEELKLRKSFKDINGHLLPINYRLGNYCVIYGLYSRHGKFYPPYNFLPDINWQQFILYNLF